MRGCRGMPSARTHVVGGFAFVGASSFSRQGSPRSVSCADGMIGYGVALVFGQPFLQTTYDLAGAPKCVCNRVPKHFSSCHDP